MALFTLVDDGYNVDVYTSIRAIVDFAVCNQLRLEGEAEEPASANAIRKALREESYVMYLYEADRSDWAYRIERQSKTY